MFLIRCVWYSDPEFPSPSLKLSWVVTPITPPPLKTIPVTDIANVTSCSELFSLWKPRRRLVPINTFLIIEISSSLQLCLTKLLLDRFKDFGFVLMNNLKTGECWKTMRKWEKRYNKTRRQNDALQIDWPAREGGG